MWLPLLCTQRPSQEARIVASWYLESCVTELSSLPQSRQEVSSPSRRARSRTVPTTVAEGYEVTQSRPLPGWPQSWTECEGEHLLGGPLATQLTHAGRFAALCVSLFHYWKIVRLVILVDVARVR